jgi:hypothetical protein
LTDSAHDLARADPAGGPAHHLSGGVECSTSECDPVRGHRAWPATAAVTLERADAPQQVDFVGDQPGGGAPVDRLAVADRPPQPREQAGDRHLGVVGGARGHQGEEQHACLQRGIRLVAAADGQRVGQVPPQPDRVAGEGASSRGGDQPALALGQEFELLRSLPQLEDRLSS